MRFNFSLHLQEIPRYTRNDREAELSDSAQLQAAHKLTPSLRGRSVTTDEAIYPMKKKQTINYQLLKTKAKKLYSKIGRIPSPALSNEYVAFTNKGFTHLVRKGRNPRPQSEQIKRFALLAFAEKIIKNPQAIIIYRTTETKYYINRHGQKILTTSTAHFWTFVENIKGTKIKVVVRQLNQGQKHFFSIMSNKKSP